MVQRRQVVFGIAATAASGVSAAATAGGQLQELQNEVSRAQLFERVIKAKRAEPPPAIGEPMALPGNFQFPSNAAYDDGKPRQDSFFGIDISHYTSPDIAFEKLRQQGISFVYVKATQGNGLKDGKFAEFYQRLKMLASGQQVLRGAYHFLSSQSDGKSQADTFCDFVGQNGGFSAGDLPPVMDLEWDVDTTDGPDRWQGQDQDEIIGTAQAFLSKVQERTGMVPMIYTTVSWWNEREIPLSSFEKFKNYRLWIADYSKSSRAVEDPHCFPDGEFNLWQFSSSARLALGYVGELDANIFRGTRESFKQSFGVDLP
jgi:lysozyme